MSLADKLLKNRQPDTRPEPETAPTDIVATASAFAVKTDAEYTKASDLIKQIITEIKAADAEMDPLIASAHQTHKQLCEKKRTWVEPFKKAELYLRGQMSAFTTAKEKARLEAERKAREAQEAEKRRLQAEADRIRREQEAADRKAQVEAEKLAAAGKAEEAEKAMESARLDAEKRQAEIQMKMDEAASMPAVSAQNSTPQVDGISYVTEYVAEVVDDAAVPVEFNGMMLRPVDMATVNRLAKSSKGKINIPGIKITEKKSARVRA